MEARLIDAGRGDCIALRYQGDSGSYRNLVFDSGPMSRRSEFARLVDEVRQRGERIDLMVITHQDEDHLGGLLAMLRFHLMDASLIDLLLMNTEETQDKSADNDDESLSAKQRASLYQLARDSGIRISTRATSGDSFEIDGARVDIVAPSEMERMPKQLPSDGEDAYLSSGSDWSIGYSTLLSRGLLSRDTSPSNRSSIVAVVQHGGVRVLLPGDAPADRFLTKLSAYGRPAHFDLVKLPHHGSARSVSTAWDCYVDCSHYVICADGRRHPDKATIALLSTWGKAMTVFSPRRWWDPTTIREIETELGGNPRLVQTDAIELRACEGARAHD